MHLRPLAPALFAAAVLPLSGCWILSTAVDDALGTAASTAGNKVGERMGGQVADSVYPGGPSAGASGMTGANDPRFMAMWTGVIFNYAFSAGGMDVSDVPYKVGEYTRFTISPHDGKGGGTIERAHIGDDADGNQWWKVKFTDAEKNETTILEALIDKDMQHMVRLRAKFPQDKEGHELALTDRSYFTPPARLSPASIKGATVGTEAVTTPAGSFTARHVVFGNGSGSAEWWLVDSIPGGLVKEAGKNAESKEDGYDLVLAAYGTGATSELGSK